MGRKIKFYIGTIGVVFVLLLGSTAFAEPVFPSYDELEMRQMSCVQSVPHADVQLFSADDETADKKPLTNQKLLTILIEFEDVEMKYSAEFWSKQMFDTDAGAISVAKYWEENANGLRIFEPANTQNVDVERKGLVSYKDGTDINYEITECADGVVRIKLYMPHPVRTWNNSAGTEICKTVELAFKGIEQDFDFNKEQPHIVTIFAGYNMTMSQGAGQGQILGHTPLAGIESSEGVNLGLYTVQGELLYNDIPEGIGTTCHELGHSVFGLPDLYFNTFPGNGYESNGVTAYSLMAVGNLAFRYNENDEEAVYNDPYAGMWGHVPTHLDAWSKIKLGYVTPIVVNGEWEGDIKSISDGDSNSAYNVLEIRSKADPKQYFLVENRQLIGFDKGLEYLNNAFDGEWGNKQHFNGGIIIYHIDENVSYNHNNESEQHCFMQIERSTNARGAAGWQYLNAEGRNNRFNAETLPNSNLHVADMYIACSRRDDCHPQTIPSGISIEVLSDSSPSMRVHAKLDDEYVIGKPNTKFSEVFPDINFCDAVIEILEQEDGIHRTPDSILTTNDWSKIMTINILRIPDRNIKDLRGIEYFSKIIILNCKNNQLTNLDVSQNTDLIQIICNNNKLTDINISNCKNLTWFQCENNLLEKLDVSNNRELNSLRCSGNLLTELDISNNPDIEKLHCYDNYLSEDYKNGIIGWDKTVEPLGEPGDKENKKDFTYYPQKTLELSPTPTPSPTPTSEPTPSPTPTVEPSPTPTPEQVIECMKITAEYSDGVLQSIKTENVKAKLSEIVNAENTKERKVFYWKSLESMEPITAEQKVK